MSNASRLMLRTYDTGDGRFIMQIKTDNPGTSASNQFIIPTNSGSYTYDYNVETSDGQTFFNQTGDLTITFPSAGTYEIKISGTFPHIYFNNGTDGNKLLKVLNWGNIEWLDFERAFLNCDNFTEVTATDVPDLSQVSDFGSSFNNCDNLISINNINNWQINNLLGGMSMSNMFGRSNNLDVDISNWDISNVITFGTQFMLNVTLSTVNYDAILVGWESTLQNVYPGGVGYTYTITINFGNSQYTIGSAAETARTSLINNFGWVITDGGGI